MKMSMLNSHSSSRLQFVAFILILLSKWSNAHKHTIANSTDPRLIGQSRYYELVKTFREKNEDDSDKISSHHYEIMYGQYLEPFFDEHFKLLEIGVLKGQSLHLWSRVFKNIDHVYGVGYGEGITTFDKKKVVDQKTTQYYADQSSTADLDFIIQDIGKESIHVINDDGSHIPWHQAFTFEKLFSELLAPGGVYILEDIETSYWNKADASLYGYPIKEAGLGERGSVIEKFKSVVDVINRRFFNAKEYSVMSSPIDHQISSLSFSRNCIIIHKKNPMVGWDTVDEYMRTSGGYPHGQSADHASMDKYMEEYKKPVTGTPS